MNWRRQQVGKCRHVAARHGPKRGRDLGFGGNVGGQRLGEFVGVVGKHETRRQQLHEIAELAIVP